MDRLVRSQNVERYLGLLERVTEPADRQKIIGLPAEERKKQKDAGDPTSSASRWLPHPPATFYTSKQFGDIELDQGRRGRKSRM